MNKILVVLLAGLSGMMVGAEGPVDSGTFAAAEKALEDAQTHQRDAQLELEKKQQDELLLQQRLEAVQKAAQQSPASPDAKAEVAAAKAAVLQGADLVVAAQEVVTKADEQVSVDQAAAIRAQAGGNEPLPGIDPGTVVPPNAATIQRLIQQVHTNLDTINILIPKILADSNVRTNMGQAQRLMVAIEKVEDVCKDPDLLARTAVVKDNLQAVVTAKQQQLGVAGQPATVEGLQSVLDENEALLTALQGQLESLPALATEQERKDLENQCALLSQKSISIANAQNFLRFVTDQQSTVQFINQEIEDVFFAFLLATQFPLPPDAHDLLGLDEQKINFQYQGLKNGAFRLGLMKPDGTASLPLNAARADEADQTMVLFFGTTSDIQAKRNLLNDFLVSCEEVFMEPLVEKTTTLMVLGLLSDPLFALSSMQRLKDQVVAKATAIASADLEEINRGFKALEAALSSSENKDQGVAQLQDLTDKISALIQQITFVGNNMEQLSAENPDLGALLETVITTYSRVNDDLYLLNKLMPADKGLTVQNVNDVIKNLFYENADDLEFQAIVVQNAERIFENSTLTGLSQDLLAVVMELRDQYTAFLDIKDHVEKALAGTYGQPVQDIFNEYIDFVREVLSNSKSISFVQNFSKNIKLKADALIDQLNRVTQ